MVVALCVAASLPAVGATLIAFCHPLESDLQGSEADPECILLLYLLTKQNVLKTLCDATVRI